MNSIRSATLKGAPDISVSIVSFNTRDLLRDCLHSLQARCDEVRGLQIIVVDNASHDGSAEMVAREFSDVHLIRAGRNLGYGRANNCAFAVATGRYFFVLNSDTQVQPGALAALRDWMDENPQVGAAGAQLVMPGGNIQPSCARDPHLLPVLWEQTYLDKLLPRNKITGAYLMTDWHYQNTREVEQVCGACLFVRREAWQAIGGFDARYFMYFEDTDFCVRLREKGWKIFFVPQARVLHRVGASSEGDWQTRALMVASYNHSRYLFFGRNGGPNAARLLKALTIFGAVLRLGAWTFAALRPRVTVEQKRDAREKVRLFRSVLRQTWKMQDNLAETGVPH